jgi:glycosyltransferase involved in cell wall biosynthesis
MIVAAMKISGFTIIRDGVKYAYPFKEAILSILPLCDEMIVNVGASDDGTLKVVESILDARIRILKREWDSNLRDGGKLLSVETNFALGECSGDWCFYIQADEVLHERYIPVVKKAMEKSYRAKNIEGLRFRYKHFYGSYDYVQDNYRHWYLKEVRVIRNGMNIVSWGDAMDFKHTDGSPLAVKEIPAEIYHYGWVRPPDVLRMKRIELHKLYHGNDEVERFSRTLDVYDDLGNLVKFEGTHPSVMLGRIASSQWEFDPKIQDQPPNWLRKLYIFLDPVARRVNRLIGKLA